MKPRRLLLIGLTVAAACFVGDVLLGYLLWRIEHEGSPIRHVLRELGAEIRQRRASDSGDPPRRVTYSPRPLFGPDPELGFVTLPGTYRVRIDETGTARHHDFTVTIDPDGTRRTGADTDPRPGGRALWLLGDSFIFGWGNDDDTTLGWFLQRYLPDRTVANLAGPGYGNVHGLLQLRRRLAAGTPAPEILIVAYADYFNERNAATPQRVGSFRFNAPTDATPAWAGADPAAFTHPRARIRDGALVIDHIPLFPAAAEVAGTPGRVHAELALAEQHALTVRVLGEILKLGHAQGCRVVLAFLHGDNADPVPARARSAGFEVADLRPDVRAGEWDDFLPFDAHPGPRAQAAYALKLYRHLSRPAPDPGPAVQ